MSTDTKLKFLLVFSTLCLVGMLWQGYLLWQVQAQLVSDSSSQPANRQSIEQRLDEAMNRSANQSLSARPLDFPSQPFPLDPFSQMQQQLDSVFGVLSSPYSPSFSGTGFDELTPQLSLSETDTEYQVLVETLPDTNVEINTEVEAQLLAVRGSVTRNLSSSVNSLASSFVSRSQFTRSFDLPKPVDELGVFTETTDDGLLIHVPKA